MKKIHSIIGTIFLLLFLISCGGTDNQSTNSPSTTAQKTSPKAKVNLVNVTDFAKIASAENTVLIDVRTPAELAETGFIKGATHLNFNDAGFPHALEGLDQNKTIAVYCKSGGRSGNTTEMLEDMGFKTIYDLEGGITAWLAAGLETVKE